MGPATVSPRRREGDLPYEPLSTEARPLMQQMVNSSATCSQNAVARNRDVGAYAVKNGFGEGRMVLAQDAVRAGMADSVATLDQTLAQFLVRRTGKILSTAAASRSSRQGRSMLLAKERLQLKARTIVDVIRAG
jgi:ClpP class serine protease